MYIKARVLILPFLMIPGSSFGQGQEHAHEHTHEHQPALTLDNGRKWATDAPLRDGMTNIRKIAVAAAPKSTADGHKLAARQMNEEVQKIFKNCKLSPKADAMLHLILADLMGSIASLNDPKANTNEAYAKITKALDQYGQYFDHPKWDNGRKK